MDDDREEKRRRFIGDSRAILQMMVFFGALTLLALYFGNMGFVITCIGVIIVLGIGFLYESRNN